MIRVLSRKLTVIVVLLVISLVFVASHHSKRPDAGRLEGRRKFKVPGFSFVYPPEWRVTLAQARSRARFPILVPNDSAANSLNLLTTYMNDSSTTVFLRFPPVGVPSPNVRETSLMVQESLWTLPDTPLSMWQDNVNIYPGYAHIVKIGAFDGLAMTPESPFDDEQANPALVRFVAKGVDIEVSGGDDLNVVINIAQSIALQATSLK